MSETKITYTCGCTVKTVASGTTVEGVLKSYCDQHNPFKAASKVEILP